MATYPVGTTFTGTVAASSKAFGFLDCQGFSAVSLMAFSNANYSVNLNWSVDMGVNTDYIDTVADIGGATVVESYPIRGRYLNMNYVDSTGVGGRALRLQLSLNTKPLSTDHLYNVGGGAEILDGAKLRTLVSADASVTITQNTSTIDLATAGASSLYGHAYNDVGGTTVNNTAVTMTKSKGNATWSTNNWSGLPDGFYLVSCLAGATTDSRWSVQLNGGNIDVPAGASADANKQISWTTIVEGTAGTNTISLASNNGNMTLYREMVISPFATLTILRVG